MPDVLKQYNFCDVILLNSIQLLFYVTLQSEIDVTTRLFVFSKSAYQETLVAASSRLFILIQNEVALFRSRSIAARLRL